MICLTRLAIGVGSVNGQTQQIAYPNLPSVKNKFIVVAHRGSHLKFPENTLEAFAEAIREGADYVEIDLRTSNDSQLIILHDNSVDRTTDGRGLVKDITLIQLKNLKIKNKPQDVKGDYLIPTFAEVLKLCKDKINIYLDFKDADPRQAYKEILKHGMEKQVIVYINNEKQFTDWRKVAPDMPLMVSLPGRIKDAADVKSFLAEKKPEILDGNFEQYTEEIVAEAERLNCFVLPDIQTTGDNPAVWDVAIKKGIRGLQTDHPGELIQYLKKINLR